MRRPQSDRLAPTVPFSALLTSQSCILTSFRVPTEAQGFVKQPLSSAHHVALCPSHRCAPTAKQASSQSAGPRIPLHVERAMHTGLEVCINPEHSWPLLASPGLRGFSKKMRGSRATKGGLNEEGKKPRRRATWHHHHLPLLLPPRSPPGIFLESLLPCGCLTQSCASSGLLPWILTLTVTTEVLSENTSAMVKCTKHLEHC